MKSSIARFLSLIVPLFTLTLPTLVYANTTVVTGDSNVEVHNQTNGTSTNCVNGKCTTTGGESHSTVCINGNCQTTDNGNIDMQSDNGKTQVHINNNTGNNSVSTSTSQETLNSSTTTDNPTMAPNPTSTQAIDNAKKKADDEKKKAEALKHQVSQKQFNLFQFITDELKKFFSFHF